MDTLHERASRGYPEAMAALAEAGEDLSFLSPEQRATAWCQTFHPRLAEGMVPCPSPLLFNLLSSLKLDRQPELSLKTVDCWLEAAVCPDPEVAGRARRQLAALDSALVDRLCAYALSRGCSGAARELWVELGHLPSRAPEAQIYLIRMGMTDRAEELDPEGFDLVQGALDLKPPFRLALAAHLRERGRGHLVPRMLGIVREDHQLDGDMVDEMLRQRQFAALWRLAPFLSTERAGELIVRLAEQGFEAGPDFARALELARDQPPVRPLFTTRGKFLGWGGSRLYCNVDGKTRVLDWGEGRTLWELEGESSQAVISPDGLWAVLKRNRWELRNPEGRTAPQRALSKAAFSPCSRYLTVGQGARGNIFRLPSLEPVEAEWWPGDRWFAEDVFVRERQGVLHFRNLATGADWQQPFPVSDQPTHGWRRSARGARWVAFLDHRRKSLIVDAEGGQFQMSGPIELLADERVLTDRSVWDGRVVRCLPELDPAWEPQAVDVQGGRRILRQAGYQPADGNVDTMAHYLAENRWRNQREGNAGLARLLESRPYLEFPGRFVAMHPNQPYLLTARGGELSVWHVPPELPLGPALLQDEARQLQSHLRPLALHLLQHRFRHEVSLEESLPLSPAHDIRLG